MNRNRENLSVTRPFAKAALVAALVAFPSIVGGQDPVQTGRLLFSDILTWGITGWLLSVASFGGKRRWLSITFSFLLIFFLVHGCSRLRGSMSERDHRTPAVQFR
jgi:hypothetical protein